jgi:hypothetical protein
MIVPVPTPEFAHFTATEIPGTLAIWVAGIGLGLAFATRGLRAAGLPFGLLAAMAGLGMLGDSRGWETWVKIGIDIAFLITASIALRWCAAWGGASRLRSSPTPAESSDRGAHGRRAV